MQTWYCENWELNFKALSHLLQIQRRLLKLISWNPIFKLGNRQNLGTIPQPGFVFFTSFIWNWFWFFIWLKILPFYINRNDVIHCQFWFFSATEKQRRVVATFGEKWLTASHFGTFPYPKIIHIWSLNIYIYELNLF